MSQTWNFYAGPAILPAPALERAKADIPDWENTGMSVMETSHRSPGSSLPSWVPTTHVPRSSR